MVDDGVAAMSILPHKAVVFDLDGTLIDSIGGVRQALNRMLEERGRRPLSRAEVEPMIGEGAAVLLRMAFAATGTALADNDLDAVRDHYLACYHADPVADTHIYDGAVAALTALRAAGLRLGICTNKPHGITQVVLERLGLAPLFDAVVGGDLLAFRKPDGRHVSETLARMGCAGLPAAYVGDSATDAQAAAAAGLPMIVVTFGYPNGDLHAMGAAIAINHYRELIPALSSLPPSGS